MLQSTVSFKLPLQLEPRACVTRYFAVLTPMSPLAMQAILDLTDATQSLPEQLRNIRSLLELPQKVTTCIVDGLKQFLAAHAHTKPIRVLVSGACSKMDLLLRMQVSCEGA